MSSPVLGSHRRTVLSQDAVASFVRSGAKLQDSTQPKCSRRIRMRSPVLVSHRMVVVSLEVEASIAPLGCHRTQVMGPWCPLFRSKSRSCTRSSTSKILTVRSHEPEATMLLAGWKCTDEHCQACSSKVCSFSSSSTIAPLLSHTHAHTQGRPLAD